MRLRYHLLLILCLIFVTSFCACRDIKNNKIDARDNKLNVKVGGVDVTVKIGETEKERDGVSRELEAVKAQLAAKDALHAEERAILQERQIELQEKLLTINGKLLTLTQQLADMRQDDAALRNEIGRLRTELKANSEETARLRKDLAAREESEKPAPTAQPAPSAESEKPEAEESEESEADDSPFSFAILVNNTDSSLSFSVVGEDGTLEARSIKPRERLVLEHSGEGIRIQFGSCNSWLNSVTRTGSRSAAPGVSELPGNYFDLDDKGRVTLVSDNEE